MKNISEHITYLEATSSPTAIRAGIENTPTPDQLKNMEIVAVACFEPLRKWYNKAIRVNSFFRCTLLNQLVNGSPTSDHCKGKSIDLSGGSRAENKKLFDWCKANLKFDQLIWEFGDDSGPDWIHISFSLGNNRNETKKAVKEGGKTVYKTL